MTMVDEDIYNSEIECDAATNICGDILDMLNNQFGDVHPHTLAMALREALINVITVSAAPDAAVEVATNFAADLVEITRIVTEQPLN